MADRAARRRAAIYRRHAWELAEAAKRELHLDHRRRRLLDLSASDQRAADQMEPPKAGYSKGAAGP